MAFPATERVIAALLAAALLARPGAAPAQRQSEPRREAVRYDLAVDGAVTAGLTLTVLALGLFRADVAPTRCRWCDTNDFDAGARDALRWSNTAAPNVASWVLMPFAIPLLAVSGLALSAHREDRMDTFAVDVLLVAEAVAVSLLVEQTIKLAVARQRPFVHALPPDERDTAPSPFSHNVSFYSGHASHAFAVVTASATLAYLRKSRFAPWFLVVGLPLAFATAYLRVAADRHYLSDVLVGSAAGTVLGVGIPLAFH